MPPRRTTCGCRHCGCSKRPTSCSAPQRRKRITVDKRRELVAAAAALRVKVDREPVSIVAIDRLAARHGLTAYDTAYLELALRRGLPLATHDEALRAAVTEAGVPTR